jgi:hypothetical protein
MKAKYALLQLSVIEDYLRENQVASFSEIEIDGLYITIVFNCLDKESLSRHIKLFTRDNHLFNVCDIVTKKVEDNTIYVNVHMEYYLKVTLGVKA